MKTPGLLARLFNRETRPAKVDAGYSLMPIGNVVAGVQLYDPQEALKAATVWRCVNLLAETTAMLPWQVFKKDTDGNSERQDSNPVDWLLSVSPNDEMGAFDFRKLMIVMRLIYGNAYAEIERNFRGQPIALWFLDPRNVTPLRDDLGKLTYRVQQPGAQAAYLDPRNMFHLKGTTLDGIRGLSVLEYAARTIAAPLAMDAASANFFGQGMRPAGFITAKGKLGLAATQNVVDFIRENFQGARNWWKPIPLDADMKFEAMQATMEEAQFIDLRKFSVAEICRLFGVPPHMAYDLDRATFSNIESQGLDFVTYAVQPLITPLEQEADRKLLSNRFGGLYTKHNVNALTRGDMAARAAWYKVMSDIGAYSPNVILRKEDENTFKGGDTRTKQAQYKPVGDKPPTDPNAADPNADPNAPPPPAPTPAPPKAYRNGNGAHA